MDYSDRIVDRLPEFDERSKNFRAAVDLPVTLKSNGWPCNVYNDQGREGACVGFAWTHELAAEPRIVVRDAAFAFSIYRRARQIDEWPGEDYDGTSVLAGVKAVQEFKNSNGYPLIGSYSWAFGLAEVLQVLSWKGPLVLGINWYYDMYFPDANGFITPTGDLVGGHAILANGVKIVRLNTSLPATWYNIDPDRTRLRLHNSWGTGYGIGGDAFITARNLGKLLNEGGEACIPSKRARDV